MTAAARRMLRWLLGGSGALRRGTDRVEAASRVLVLLALLAAVPGALLIGGAVHGHLEAVAAEQTAARHQAVAHLLRDVDASTASYDSAGRVSAQVRWTTPSGHRRDGTVPVRPSRRAGDPVPVWLTADGALTSEPLDQQSIGDAVDCARILAPVGIPLLAWGLHGLVRIALDRRRARQWATGWQAVEPVWTARPG